MRLINPTTAAIVHDVPQKQTPRLVIISETRLFGEGVADALGRDGSLIVCGHCFSAHNALADLAHLRPNIALLDAAVRQGAALAGAMSRVMPQLQIIVIALAETADSVIGWAEVGVAGYIPQTAGLCEVGPILLGIMAGEQVCSPSVAAGLFRRLSQLRAHDSAPQGHPHGPVLTAREMQIVDLIRVGLSNKQIARQLNISLSTVKSHVHNLLGKLDIQRRGQVRYPAGFASLCHDQSARSAAGV